MTPFTSAVLFRSESKGSGFHANERPKGPTQVKLEPSNGSVLIEHEGATKWKNHLNL